MYQPLCRLIVVTTFFSLKKETMKNSRDFFYAQEDINYIGGVKDDMKDDVVRFLKNNINSSVYNKQKRYYEAHPEAPRVSFNGE